MADVAGQAGFDRKPVDPKKRAGHPLGSVREHAMLETIRAQLKNTSGPVLVSTGNLHLPVLREGLLGNAHVIALKDASLTSDQWLDGQEIRQRYIDLCPEVKSFKGLDGQASRPMNDYQKFAIELGLLHPAV